MQCRKCGEQITCACCGETEYSQAVGDGHRFVPAPCGCKGTFRLPVCKCKFHKHENVYGILDSVVAEKDFGKRERSLLTKNPLYLEIYPSQVYQDGDTIFDIRHRMGCKRVRVWYQDFSLNLNAHYDDTKLVVDRANATFITEYIWNPLERSFFEFLKDVYTMQNHLCVPVGHPERPKFNQAGHTSMSIGDYVEVVPCKDPGNPTLDVELPHEYWIVACEGWRRLIPA